MKHHKRKKPPPPQYPIGTVALYGPDDKTTTKIAAGVILHDGAKAIIKRWVATDVTTNPKVQQEMKDFFLQARGQAGGDEPGEHGLPARGGPRLPPRRGLSVLPVLEGEAGEQSKGLNDGEETTVDVDGEARQSQEVNHPLCS
jgi:hypothetical protein